MGNVSKIIDQDYLVDVIADATNLSKLMVRTVMSIILENTNVDGNNITPENWYDIFISLLDDIATLKTAENELYKKGA